MNTQGTNLFIVDGDRALVYGLRFYLTKKFGNDLNISTFSTGEACLEKIDKNTKLVILAYFLDGMNGNEILKAIKEKNPLTEVVMLTNNDDIATAIEAFHNGAKDYVVKNIESKRKITHLVRQVITYPVRMMVREFGVNKYLAMFISTFIVMGTGVCLVLKFFVFD